MACASGLFELPLKIFISDKSFTPQTLQKRKKRASSRAPVHP